jgi:hypothetical protein
MDNCIEVKAAETLTLSNTADLSPCIVGLLYAKTKQRTTASLVDRVVKYRQLYCKKGCGNTLFNSAGLHA